ncbi:IS1380 family transposase, partial [Nocardia brevicatena]|uniref:IS1380 family transposase n=1 Tax=Nocardia brevicatena TaxID=37327 RepID=UPI00059330BA
MSESMSWYPSLKIENGGSPVVSPAGAGLLLQTAEKIGLTVELSQNLSPWCRPGARHDPGKIVTDLAVMLALGGDCVSDPALLRGEPGLFGAVASDPTVSRLITALAADAPKALSTIASARAQARAQAWKSAGIGAPGHGADAAAPLVIDLDATLIEAHSDKQRAAPTFKRGYGFHPLWAFIDHGGAGTGEPAAVMLRPG